MLNFEQIIAAAAHSAGDRPVLAAPYPLADVVCRRLAADGLVGGYIAERAPTSAIQDPFVAGWWIDRTAGTWFLRRSKSRTVILLSGTPKDDIGGRMLLEALLKGIQRILFVDSNGAIANAINVNATLLRRLLSGEAGEPIHQLSYESAFEEMYALIGNRLRLPAKAFSSDRVLILTGSLQPGGAERQTVYTAAGLARRSPGKIYLARNRIGGDLDFYKPIADSAGVITCRVPEHTPEYDLPEIADIRNQLAARYAGLGFLNLFYLIFHHALLIREIKPRVVHTFQEYSNIPGGAAAQLVGAPILVMSGRSVAPDNFSIFQPYMAPGYRTLLKRRDAVFLNNSEAGARDYARWLDLPRSDFHVIRNGFEFPEISSSSRQAIRTALGIKGDAVVIGSIIRFGEEKRPQLFLDMAHAIHSTHPEVRFLVYGDGPMLEPAREFVDAHNLTDVIKLPGLTRDSWTSLSAMDIFVLTSRIEGLPNVLIEAQGMGLPVICSGAGGMAETFIDGETGLTAEGAGEAMAAAARRLLSDPKLLRTMSKKAQKYARETFGLDRMVELTLDRYRDAIELRNDFVPSTESDEPGDIRLCAVQKWADGIYQAELSRTLVPFEWNLWEDSRIIAKGELAGESQEANPTRFEIVGNVVLFSTPDGSDPRFSGRTYRIRPQSAEDDYNTIPIPSTGMQPETGHCYVARLQLGSGSGRFELWEDSTLLGPGASLHDAVRQTGGGHYSVWGEQLYFSSSDNTDPRTNGRTYVLRRAKQTLASTIGIFELDATASMEQAIRHLVREAVPRAPYVPDRIVLVSGGLGPGGSERQVVYTLLGLAQQPYESVQLLCSFLTATGKDTHDFHLPTLQRARIPARAVRRQVGPNDLGSMPVALREVIKVLPRALATNVADFYWEFVELRPEIVHAWLDGNNVPAGLAAALAGVPKIFISGRNVNPSHFPYLHEPYMYAAYQALLSLPQVTMLNNSLAGRDDYAEWLGIDNNRICVVYNGVDFGDHARLNADEAKRLRAEFQLDEDAFVVGGIFRFAEEKRPLLWIETAADVARRVPEARFIIFGQGEMRTEMEAAAERLGIAERLIFGGITAEVLKVLSVMDVFLLTSALEGLPNVVLEAQWVGTPVVATRSGGTSEAVNQGTTGWIIESSSAQELADRIVWLHDNLEIRQAVRVEGPVAVKEKFGVDKMLRRTLELYGKVWPAVL